MFCRTLAYLLAVVPSEMGSLGYLLLSYRFHAEVFLN